MLKDTTTELKALIKDIEDFFPWTVQDFSDGIRIWGCENDISILIEPENASQVSVTIDTGIPTTTLAKLPMSLEKIKSRNNNWIINRNKNVAVKIPTCTIKEFKLEGFRILRRNLEIANRLFVGLCLADKIIADSL